MVVFEAREQVTVNVESHLDRTVPQERLYALRAKALLDHPRRKEVTKCVQPVTVRDADIAQQRHEAAAQMIVALDLALAVGEYEPQLALGADQTPLPQRVDDQRRQWDLADAVA